MNYSEMLYYISINPEYEVDEVMDSLENETEIQLQLLLADLYIGKEEYEKAAEIYDDLPVYDNETELMIALRTIQIELLEDGKTWFDIGTEGYPYMDDLEDIAFGDTTVASYQAMAILSLINDTLYELPFQDKEESSPKMSSNSSNETVEDKEQSTVVSNDYVLHPTIIKGDMYGRIYIPQKETGYLEIFNIQGVKTGTYNIKEGTNQIPLSTSVAQSGIYIYKVFINDENKKTSKLIKIQ